MKIKLRKFGESFTTNPTIVNVEFVKVEGKLRTTYQVFVDGKKSGQIQRVMENTDRIYNRIRVPGKGRPAWSWMHGQKANYPGLYFRNRWTAVADMLGFDDADVVKEER